MAFGKRMLAGGFDPALFFMGGAFLLVQTRGVTTLSLLFGSTWMVNSSIFAGVLAMVLLANLYVERHRPHRLRPWFGLLALSLVLLWAVDYSVLNQLPLAMRWILGGLSHALPIGIAGVIVSTLLARSPQPTASLGSNLLGAVVGGCLEYLSMLLGLRALVLLALALYLAGFLFFERRSRRPLPAPS